MVIKAFVIAGNGCESEPLHDSEVDGITGQDTTGLHLLTHLVDVSGCDRFQSDQITQRCNKGSTCSMRVRTTSGWSRKY